MYVPLLIEEYSDNEEYRPLVNELLVELLPKLLNRVLIDNDIICTPFIYLVFNKTLWMSYS